MSNSKITEQLCKSRRKQRRYEEQDHSSTKVGQELWQYCSIQVVYRQILPCDKGIQTSAERFGDF